ncbi:DUF6933 domain-containing protein [Peribacillus deserti]|uniref:DUF6933 domain-containing protein n=1 Tax=Peribacillus deserti TaxID=673318 RepID=A0A2N5M8V5_9BACI|nr:hypothetical protein [Peribacillus deserti]PLT30780.1 hypothetical protein CUU66_06405 [Peribacillus deserti]
MFVIGTTQKLMKEIGKDVSVYNGDIDNGLYHWHMNMFKLGRYKCITFINDVTLYNCTVIGVIKKDLNNISDLIRDTLKENLLAEGFGGDIVDAYLKQADEIIFTKTSSRSVLGSMTELIKYTEAFYYRGGKEIIENDPLLLNNRNNRMVFMNIKGYSVNQMKDKLVEEFLE